MNICYCALFCSFKDHDASIFELNIRILGGLLSTHSLTQDPVSGLLTAPPDFDGRSPWQLDFFQIFLDAALKIANMFLPAFNTPTGLPFAHLENLE